MTAQRPRQISNPKRFATACGAGQWRLQLAAGRPVFVQGDLADALYYVESGQVQMSVVSPTGREAVIALCGAGEFIGTRCLVKARRRTATAITLTSCTFVRITPNAVTRMLREEAGFAEMLVISLASQQLRVQENLIDQLTNSSEKRLARALLQLANNGYGGNPSPIPARINQAVLANMIGTTRPRVSFFMNRFRRQGFIEYDRHGHVSVRPSLLSVLRRP
jgi:CRP/FNR family transcriptional regulator, cyclic AMP receptor protein